jgi:flagellin-like hook-associated protein FlgL
MRNELLAIAQQQNAALAQFQVELAKLDTRRAAEARSTTHGNDFEAALLRWLERRANEAGDLFEATANVPGAFQRSKVGDAVVELGPENRAAGARIVFEAKESASTRLPGAREELETARKNRSAEVGVFVLSAKSAPEGWERFRVIGPDLFVTWDADDLASDVVLESALAVARALCTRARRGPSSDVDFEAFERAIRAVEKQIEGIDEIRTSAGTIESSAGKIKKRVEILESNLRKAVATLDECREATQTELGAED